MINLSSVKGLVVLGKTFMMAHRPELLFGASITATLASVGLAAKGGYEARGVIERERADRVLNGTDEWYGTYLEFSEAMDNAPEIPLKEKVQLTWLCYVPAALTTLGAVGSTTGLHVVHVNEKKALAQAALMAIEEIRSEANEYVESVKTVIEDPEKKPAEKVKELKSGLENSDGELEEMYLVRDARTGRDIWSNQHRIESALIDTHNAINGSGECDLNYFYSNAGFANIPDGFNYGWSGVLPSIEWGETVRDDGRPVRVFTFQSQPEKGYDKAT